MKKDPDRYEAYLQKERERYIKRKEKGQIKSVTQLSKRARNLTRRQWRINKRNQRAKEIILAASNQFVTTNTPPLSPEALPVNEAGNDDLHVAPQEPAGVSPNLVAAQKRGRKKVKNRQTKTYKDLTNAQTKLKKALTKVERYKKRCSRLSKMMHPEDSPQTKARRQSRTSQRQIGKVLLFHNVVMEELKESSKSLTNPKEKQVLSKVIAGKIIKKYRLGKYARQQFSFSQKMMRANQKRPSSLEYHRKRQSNVITDTIETTVTHFLERDDNSRATTGKRDTVTRKQVKMQKRLLSDSLKNLHLKFKEENPTIKISYSEFCKRKPFWIVHPSVKDRETCLCKLCENTQFMADRLFQQSVVRTSKVEDLMLSMCCAPPSKECMYRECSMCKMKALQTLPFEEGSPTWWNQWQHKAEEREKKSKAGETKKFTVHLTTKEKVSGTLQILVEDFSELLQAKMGRHSYNIKHQYSTLRELRENLSEDEVLLHVDFAENYLCKYASEIQAVHFGDSHQQVSLHTGVAYTKAAQSSYCTLSSSFRHDPPAIWAHLRPVLQHLQENNPSARVLHMVSDGPTTQYRSKKNFFLLSTEPFKMGFKQVTWNFLESGHGKGPADGVGAAVKRTADALVAKGMDIQNGAKLHEELSKVKSSVTLFNVTDQEITEVEKSLIDDLETVKGTMKIHQVCNNAAPLHLRNIGVPCWLTGQRHIPLENSHSCTTCMTTLDNT